MVSLHRLDWFAGHGPSRTRRGEDIRAKKPNAVDKEKRN